MVLYSFLYYRGLGLVSVSSLIVAAVLAYLSVVLLSKYASSGFSLSLAGIAGLIVGDRHHRGLVRRVLRAAP